MKITYEQTDFWSADQLMDREHRMFDIRTNRFFGTKSVRYIIAHVNGVKHRVGVRATWKKRWENSNSYTWYLKNGAVCRSEDELRAELEVMDF